jgi:hypothetical protein
VILTYEKKVSKNTCMTSIHVFPNQIDGQQSRYIPNEKKTN